VFAPHLLRRGKDAQLVIHHYLALRRVASLDIGQCLLLVNVDEHMSPDGSADSRALDLERLKNHIAIRRNKQDALVWLERTVALGDTNYPWFQRDKNYESLRAEPEY